MDFFIRYAEEVELQLNEDASNIGDIAVDWEALLQKETTATTNDTSEAVPNEDCPKKDGFMPDQPKRSYKIKEDRIERERLRDIWKRTHMVSTLEHSEPIELRNTKPGHSASIIRKVVKTIAGQKVRRKAFAHVVK